MTTNRDIVNRAHRKLGAGGKPGSTLPASRAEAGMELLSGMYLEWVQAGVFGRLNNHTATADLTALPGQRIYAQTGVTISLPSPFNPPYNTVPDFIWDYGHPRWNGDPPLVDKALIAVVQDGVERMYVYKAATGAWVNIADQNLDADFPLDAGLENGTASMLALRLAPEYGQEPSALVVREASNAQVALTHRYNNPSSRAFDGNPYGYPYGGFC